MSASGLGGAQSELQGPEVTFGMEYRFRLTVGAFSVLGPVKLILCL